MKHEFTKTEKDFFARMAVYMAEGQTFDQAAKSVVNRDRQLVEMFQTNEKFRSHVTEKVKAAVYSKARSAA